MDSTPARTPVAPKFFKFMLAITTISTNYNQISSKLYQKNQTFSGKFVPLLDYILDKYI